MKKLLLIFLIPFLIFVAGCGDDAEEVIDAPNQFTLAGADGLELTFNWVESETADIDGYIFYLDTVAFDTVGTVSSATVNPPGLGEITIKTYKGDKKSAASTAVSTEVVSMTDLTIYDFDVAGQPSGLGWDANGNGTIYNFTQANEDSIDIYLDDDFDLASPDTYVPAKWNICNIIMVGADVDYAPASGYSGAFAASPYVDSFYVVRLPSHGTEGGNQFAKIKVTSLDQDTSITFDYMFQPIEKYRRYK